MSAKCFVDTIAGVNYLWDDAACVVHNNLSCNVIVYHAVRHAEGYARHRFKHLLLARHTAIVPHCNVEFLLSAMVL